MFWYTIRLLKIWRRRIKSNIEETRGIVGEVDAQSKTVNKLMKDFDNSVKEAQSGIIESRSENMKQLVDQHVQALLEELEDERTKKVKEFETVKEELFIQKLSLESFMKYSEAIVENAIPAEVASVTKDLSVRFESLKRIENSHILEILWEMSFIPHESTASLHWWMEIRNNIIGKIEVHGNIVCEYIIFD